MNTYGVKIIRLLLAVMILGSVQPCAAAIAKWCIPTYMQADNNLASFAGFNVREMQKVRIPSSVNVVVEWDKPEDAKTWRYQIKYKQLLDAGTFTGAYDLGTNPIQELIDMSSWAKANFNASKWCFILWSHGYGILDPRLQKLNQVTTISTPKNRANERFPWLMLPGLSYGPGNDRGILFDDTQNTYVTASGLTQAITGMRNAIGQKIELLCMDACLMAMVEVGYQVKGLVDILVASENTEPGNGFHYAGFLAALSNNPDMTPRQLAAAIVEHYGIFYAGQDNSVTLSAISVDALTPLKDNINALVGAINTCYAANATATKAAVQAARKASMSFEVSDYVDLLSLYNQLSKSFVSHKATHRLTAKQKPKQKPVIAGAAAFNAGASAVRTIIAAGISLINTAVLAKTNGSDFRNACGLSIYFPLGPVDRSYADTQFARDTNWDLFIARYR